MTEEGAEIGFDDQLPDFGRRRLSVFLNVSQDIVEQFAAGDFVGLGVQFAAQDASQVLVAELLGLVERLFARRNLARFAVLEILEVVNSPALLERTVAVTGCHGPL
jgi:hypothetical protein